MASVTGIAVAVILPSSSVVGDKAMARAGFPDRWRSMAARNFSRSSALSMASPAAPIISTPNFSRTCRFLKIERAVERGLPAHGRQQRVRALLLDDLGDKFRRDRLDVGGIGQVRIGHDRRRVRVHQDDAVAFFAQCLAGLSAGIIEFTGLADDNRTGTNDQDRRDICAFWHLGSQLAAASPDNGRYSVWHGHEVNDNVG